MAEIVAISIRDDTEIKGIKILDETFKIVMLADDTTLFIKNIPSLIRAIDKFLEFEHYSGLKLNLSKTEIIPIGSLKSCSMVLPEQIKQIQINNGPFKALGIW